MSDDSSHSADESVSDAETPVDDQQTVSLEKAGGDTADEPKAPDSDDSDSDDSGSQDDAADSAPVGTVPSEAQVRSKRTRMLVTAAAGVAALVALVFAVIFGIAMAGIPYDQSLPLRQFFEGLFAVSQKMIAMAMRQVIR